MNERAATWPDEFATRYRNEGYWQGKTFDDFLHDRASQYTDSIALIDGDQRITYAELNTRATTVASGLLRLGIDRGDRVLVQLPNCAEFVEVWFALQRIGAVPVRRARTVLLR